MSISTINPANGKTLRTFKPYSAVQVSEALDRGVAAFRKHHRTFFAERATRMRKVAGILNAECRELGRLMTVEMGKPIKAAMAEAEKCATACNYYVENAEKFLATSPCVWKAARAGSPFNRWASCSPSCRGIFRSGRSFGLPPRR